MADTVRRRLTHYETLGVSPTAAGDEIARAFARESGVFRPHAFGGLAELCIAYETLRDPIKRRAYDAALGLKREPSLPNRSLGARLGPAAEGGEMAAPVERHATNVMSPPASQPKPQPFVARGLGSVDGELLQKSGNSHPGQSIPAVPKSALPLGPGANSNARPEPRISPNDSYRPLEEVLGAKVRPINWRRTGIALGTVAVGACVLGGLAGWWSATAINETPQPDNAVSVSLPPAKPQATPAAPDIAPAPVPNVPEKRGERPKPAIAAAPIEPELSEPQPVTAEEQPQERQADPISIEQAADEAPTPSAVAAAMPLPDRVIARTIERIGYACGSVSSAVPVEGEAPGVYKVTCSSGQSYQARPVNGRYHFRRWGRR